jgi:hypothetical protein
VPQMLNDAGDLARAGKAAILHVFDSKRQASVAAGLVRGDGDFLVEDDIGGLLALADLRAGLGPLPGGAEHAGGIALLVGRRPKVRMFTPR